MSSATLDVGNVSFTYDVTRIADLQVDRETDAKGKSVVKAVRVKDEPFQPTTRFWTSLFATFGFNKAFFKYFNEAEVFDRISGVEKSDRLRVCVERGEDKHGQPVNRLLGVSKPTKPMVDFNDLMGRLNGHNALGVQYADGIVESFHQPRVGGATFDVAGDLFQNRFVMATPIDGYGQPNVYLSLLRQICSNGMIAYAKAFKSTIALGKGNDDTEFSMTRVLDQFSNDEGYAALRQRFESAATSWSSVYETHTLYKLVTKLVEHAGLEQDYSRLDSTPFLHKVLQRATGGDAAVAETGPAILRAFHALTGDTSRLYGLANVDALSVKRQRTLPVQCTVYDAINFATELATHHSDVPASRQLQAWVGTLISGEYDMEGTKEKFGEFADFHIQSKLQSGMTGSEFRSN